MPTLRAFGSWDLTKKEKFMTVQVDLLTGATTSATPSCPGAATAEDAGFQSLVQALRFPAIVFGDAVASTITAVCDLADWDATSAALKRILRARAKPATELLAMLRLAGEFSRQHGIRLQGSPWLCTFEEDDEWIRYVLHTSLDFDEADTWDSRFEDVLTSHGFLRDCLFVQFSTCGPR